MNMMRSMAFALLAGALTTAHSADHGFYFGGSGGQASYDFASAWFVGPMFASSPIPVLNPGISPPPVPFVGGTTLIGAPLRAFWIPGKDDEATGWSVLAGYRLFRYAAIELSYHDLGTLSEYSPAQVIGPITTLEVSSKLESTGATLSLLGQLPITERWNLYVRAGGLFVDQEVSRRSSAFSTKDSYDSEVFLYGIGTQVDFGAHWSVRLDFQRFDDVGKGHGLGEADVEMLSLGVLFRLGSQ